MKDITTCFWYSGNADEAVDYYMTVFKDAEILERVKSNKESAAKTGLGEDAALTITFRIGTQKFMALNGGPYFALTPAASIIVTCDTQKEIDEIWSKLSHVPEAEQCGWLQDKFGLSWQIVPRQIDELMKASPEKANKVMGAMMNMKKLDIAALERAAGPAGT